MYTVLNNYTQYVRIFSYFPLKKWRGGVFSKIRGEIQDIIFTYSTVQYKTSLYSIYSTSKFAVKFKKSFYVYSTKQVYTVRQNF